MSDGLQVTITSDTISAHAPVQTKLQRSGMLIATPTELAD